mmetsp:Transcript_21525/g.33010  ORF Transcript_21525/g.33010 Transcript_21525/m.33010 type:complete len:116 (-) Transcript_21525:1784-2131(-)
MREAKQEANKLQQAEILISIVNEVVDIQAQELAIQALGPRDRWAQDVREALLDGCVTADEDFGLRQELALEFDKAMRARAVLYEEDDEDAPAIYNVQSWFIQDVEDELFFSAGPS